MRIITVYGNVVRTKRKSIVKKKGRTNVKKESVSIYSDVTGDLIKGKVTRAVVNVKSKNYAVDLDDEKLEEELAGISLADVFAKGERVKVASTRTRRRNGDPAARALQKEARKWAKENGYSVGDRGVVPQAIIKDYKSAKGLS